MRNAPVQPRIVPFIKWKLYFHQSTLHSKVPYTTFELLNNNNTRLFGTILMNSVNNPGQATLGRARLNPLRT